MKVKIQISDPWDLGESIAWRPMMGEVLKADNKDNGFRALIKLDEMISLRGSALGYLVAQARHHGGLLEFLQLGRELSGGFIGVSEEHATSSNSLSIEHGRGGLTFIGSIVSVD